LEQVVIGCITKYDYKQIEPWVVSLERSGYTGHKHMIVYDIEASTIEKLLSKGFGITRGTGQSSNICVNRFHDLALFHKMHMGQYHQVVSTDVKDVVFQTNPFEYDFDELIVSTEGIKYKDEPWGKNNLTLSFGDEVYNNLKNQEIYNAGVIGGRLDTVTGLSSIIYQLCAGRPQYVPGGGGPDQAALNFLLNTPAYTHTQFTQDWVCQAGTTADPTKIEQFRPNLFVEEPIMTVGGVVTNQKYERFTMVHQYDRVPLWKEIIDRKYRD